MIPTFVVVPMKDQLPLTVALVDALERQHQCEAVFVLDNGSQPDTRARLDAWSSSSDLAVGVDASGLRLSEMWNLGVRLARQRVPMCNVAILNNDIEIGDDFLERLAAALRSDDRLWAVSASYNDRVRQGVQYVTSTWKNGGLAGFAFMARGEAFEVVSFDEGFEWWYGDDDFVASIEAAGACVAIAGAADVVHIDGGSMTARHHPELSDAIDRDRRRMFSKWGHY